ncbi:MAG: cysteine--tRNA ligase [Gammaproteobacteria bacterium]|nr:cysteine--tRNA ligase [Gammaproteobacteria bacterium]
MLEIYNSLSRRKQAFRAPDSGPVRMYVCGITVYDYIHLGHARMLIVFDLVARYLRSRGYQLTYVRNITDVDDKIIARANQNGEPVEALTQRFIDAMHEDEDALGIARPDLEPRATVHMPQILGMIGRLVENGSAYLAGNGDVYFRVRGFAAYGQLSGRTPDEMLSAPDAAADVDPGEEKEDPLDFALWKAVKPGEPSWDSPWGPGRPGWHIECSAMSTHCLGDSFDIHGGGQDLRFPHHENEIAQSESATGARFVDVWMHNGFVRVDEEKMSKSLGNFFTVRDLLQHYDAEVIRFFVLSSHYRSPLNYTDSSLEQARNGLQAYYLALQDIPAGGRLLEHWQERFRAAMDDDFNTAEAMAVLADLRHEINRARDGGPEPLADLGYTLRTLAEPLALLQRPAEDFLRGTGGGVGGLSDAEIAAQLAEREQARADRDWARADGIRDALASKGVILEDGAAGTSWRRT